MALKLNEVAINKSCSVELDPDTIAIVSLMYHTADSSAKLAAADGAPDHSWYKYEVRVEKKAVLQAEVDSMKSIAHRLEPWTWPNPTWPKEFFLGYDGDNNKGKGAKWLRMKLKKAMPWDTYVLLVRDGIKTFRSTGERKQYAYAQYLTEGYVSDDGHTTVSILDKNALIAQCGHCLSKIVPKKVREAKA